MALAGGNILSLLDTGPDQTINFFIGGVVATAAIAAAAICLARILHYPGTGKAAAASTVAKEQDENPGFLRSVLIFAWACFVKPHEKTETAGAKGGATQQVALESFYRRQAGIYDRTRKTLLKGREDMLALVAAQLTHKTKSSAAAGQTKKEKRIWVDVGGGTGYNIEAMNAVVPVPDFFSKVYLVDFSPSLCEIAKKRFARLGWGDFVSVVCCDARTFRLPDEGCESGSRVDSASRSPNLGYFSQKPADHRGADLITMSYSLSMIPDFYSIVDSLTSLLAPQGTIGVVDFYAQSSVDASFRNYTGGSIGRHVNFVGRTFWRAWFDVDRVNLEGARRDYLEYRFGTVLSINTRNWLLGAIPYYIWLGCAKRPVSVSVSAAAAAGVDDKPSNSEDLVERLDALATESPYLNPSHHAASLARAVERSASGIRRSKAFDAAVLNLAADLPLPSFFYQNHHWRIYYDDALRKHTQFGDEYIYAFTWEDSRVDERLLKLGSDDIVLAITSAGDNVLSYALRSPARIHAVDLNPAQNHLLELKVASLAAGIGYADFWAMFGEGRHVGFRDLLVRRLSPHLSSRAFQYWLRRVHVFAANGGLYDSGGSKHGIRIFRWLSRLFGIRGAVADLLAAKTLTEQRELWRARIRPALLSRLVARLVVSQEAFLWAALGVPRNQLAMIEADHAAAAEKEDLPNQETKTGRSHAVWQYMVDTLDPVVERTHVAADNPYYLVTLQGKFGRKCHPDYLSPQAYARLSRPGALDGLRIHTDEIDEVLARLSPGTLTVAVVMDSMDWFDPTPPALAAERQVQRLNRALRSDPGGRVLLRSAALRPWYIDVFVRHGFVAKCVGRRSPGQCIDRVNMYASCWILTKERDWAPPTSSTPSTNGDEIQEIEL